MKPKIYFIIGFVVLLGGVATFAYILIKRKRKAVIQNKAAEAVVIPVKPVNESMVEYNFTPSESTEVANESSYFSSLPFGSFPIARGQKSQLVYLLQLALNYLYNSNLEVDGIFGRNTESAMKKAFNKTSLSNRADVLAVANLIKEKEIKTGKKDTNLWAVLNSFVNKN